jgi:hypothetical protein
MKSRRLDANVAEEQRTFEQQARDFSICRWRLSALTPHEVGRIAQCGDLATQSSPASCSTIAPVLRRSLASSIRMNAFVSVSPSCVARNSFTKSGARSCLAIWRVVAARLQEKWNSHLQHAGEMVQPAGADPVRSFLVFLQTHAILPSAETAVMLFWALSLLDLAA